MRRMTEAERALAEECMQFVRPAIQALCRAYPGIRHSLAHLDAESIAHLAVCRAAQTYRPDKSQPSTYFSRAVQNALLKELAKTRTKGRASVQRVPLEAVELFLHKDSDQALVLAVASLPEDAVDLIRRRYYHGETLTDIARRDGCTRSTVRRRLTAALALVRASLETRRRGHG